MGRKTSKYNEKSSKEYSPPKALTEKQQELIDTILTHEMVFILGPAGTGKTYVTTCLAAYLYKQKVIDKIVITRPTVPTGRSIGFFPGDLEEKMAPWAVPVISVLEEYLSQGAVETMLKKGSIEIVPFEVIRGRTFDNSFVILDEAQNATVEELKAFLTRHGKHSKTIINGDLSQTDLKKTGLKYVLDILNKGKTLQRKVKTVEFDSKDVVRSGVCGLWVKAFNREMKNDSQ